MYANAPCIRGLKRCHRGSKWAGGRPKWGTNAHPKGSKWAHGKPKLSWGEPWAAKRQPKSAQVRHQGLKGDFWANLGLPKGTQKRSKLSQKNVTKWEAVMNTILGSDLDRFGYPKQAKNSQSKAANEHDRTKTPVTKYIGKTNEKYTFLDHVRGQTWNVKGLGRYKFKFQTHARFWSGNWTQIGTISGTFWSSNRVKFWNEK